MKKKIKENVLILLEALLIGFMASCTFFTVYSYVNWRIEQKEQQEEPRHVARQVPHRIEVKEDTI